MINDTLLAKCAGEDGACVIWDMVKHPYPTYVRTIDASTAAGNGVPHLVQVSKTSGDVALVTTDAGRGRSSQLLLYTINGKKVGQAEAEPPVTALAFSTTPEGVAANAIATGHAGNVGVIR